MESSIIDVDHILNICQARCEDLDVSFKWDENAETAYTDGHTICFPVPSHPIGKEALDVLYGYVIHECGHHLRPDAFSILRAAKPPQHVASLYNIVEDDGMERERAKAYRGDRSGLARMNSLLIKDAVNHWELQSGYGFSKAQEPEPLAAMIIGQLSRMTWDTETEPALNALIKHLPDNAKELITDLTDEGWVERYRETDTAHDTWDVTIDLVKRLYPNRDEDEYEDIRKKGHSKEGQRDDSNTKMPDPIGASEGNQKKGKSLDSEGNEVDEDEGTTDDGEGTTVNWKDCVLSDHTEFEEGGKGGNLGITWAGRIPTGGVKLMPTKEVNVYNPRTSRAVVTKDGWGGYNKYMSTNTEARQFANNVRRYIQAKQRSKVRRGQETGLLDKGALVRLGMPPIDGGEWNRKIFYDMTKRKSMDTAIFVLTDWSGSMLGRKMQYAADASQRLVHTFERVLKMPVALAAFTNRRTKCDIGYIKPFATRGMTEDTIARSFKIFENWSCGNNDADAVHWAYKQLLKRKESRKILIVLSDGAPSGSYAGHAADCLRTVTKFVEKQGKAELYGVGICDEDVKEYYTNYRVVWDPSDINKTLFELLKDGDNV